MSAFIRLTCPHHRKHRYTGMASIRGGCPWCQKIQSLVDLAERLAEELGEVELQHQKTMRNR